MSIHDFWYSIYLFIYLFIAPNPNTYKSVQNFILVGGGCLAKFYQLFIDLFLSTLYGFKPF